MFGDYAQNFGFNAFPFAGIDPAGGIFGVNSASDPSQAATGAPPPSPGAVPGGQSGTVSAAPTGGQAPPPAQSPLGSPLSPTAVTPLAPETATAPAAGVGSPFGKSV
jgi:hypothetical protein